MRIKPDGRRLAEALRESHQSIAGRDNDDAIGRLGDTAHLVIVSHGVAAQQIVGMDEAHSPILLLLYHGNAPFKGSHPESVLQVLVHIIYLIAGQGIGLLSGVLIVGKLPIAAQAIEAVALGAYPHASLAVFIETIYMT